MSEPDSSSKLSPEDKAALAKWLQTWQETGPILERLRREELRNLDTYRAISNLLGSVDYSQEPFRPKPTSGLILQQAWFKKLKR
jgi:hypothetical protein